MIVLITLFLLIMAYTINKITDAYVLPICYFVDEERNLEDISFDRIGGFL